MEVLMYNSYRGTHVLHACHSPFHVAARYNAACPKTPRAKVEKSVRSRDHAQNRSRLIDAVYTSPPLIMASETILPTLSTYDVERAIQV
jgi:hypothetical protein